MKNALSEFVGTLLLVLVFGLTVVPPNVGPFAPLAIGAVLAALISAGGRLSMPHYNPALTLASWLRGRSEAKSIAPVMLAQLMGGIAAALLVYFFRSGNTVHLGVFDPVKALAAEFLFTFLLAYVFLNFASQGTGGGNSSAGLMVGLAYCAGLYGATPLSGGSLNPAVSVGLCVAGAAEWSAVWIPLIGSFAGAAFAAIISKSLAGGEIRP
jgi:aquaporin Z